MSETRLRRSLLFVPGSEQRRIEKAATTAADSIVLDLEDAVSIDRKDEARQIVADALASKQFAEQECAVRVNPLGTPWYGEDLAAAREANAIVIPKAERPEQLVELRRQLEGVVLIALVETPLGIINIAALAAEADAVCFGHVDFSTEMGLADADPSQGSVFHARCQLAIAAKASGIPAVDNVCLAIKDEETLRADIALGISLGYEGKLCIHPRQVELANELYSPSEEQISFAQQVIEAAAEAEAAGKGVFTINNKMIDLPVINAQHKVLERARRAGIL